MEKEKNTSVKVLSKDCKEVKKKFGKRNHVRVYLRRESNESKYKYMQRKRREKEDLSSEISMMFHDRILDEKEVIVLDSEEIIEKEKSE